MNPTIGCSCPPEPPVQDDEPVAFADTFTDKLSMQWACSHEDGLTIKTGPRTGINSLRIRIDDRARMAGLFLVRWSEAVQTAAPGLRRQHHELKLPGADIDVPVTSAKACTPATCSSDFRHA